MKKIILLTLFFSSCVATQKDMVILQSQIDDLNANIYTLKKNQADLSLKIEELNRNLIAFNENSKDLNIEITKLSNKIDEYGIQTDKKINQLDKNLSQKVVKDENRDIEKEIFYKGLSFYSSKKYIQAIESLKEYIVKFPKGENLDNAYFYLADSLFDINNFKEAAIFYAKIISLYPSFPKMAYVRLKYSLALLNLKDSSKIDEAITYLKSVIKEYPDLAEAEAAKQILSKLQKKQTEPQNKNIKKQ